jgi:hypothetical protein
MSESSDAHSADGRWLAEVLAFLGISMSHRYDACLFIRAFF